MRNFDIFLFVRISFYGNFESVVWVIYYNNCYFDGICNEKCIICWGKGSLLLNKENIGVLIVFVFYS